MCGVRKRERGEGRDSKGQMCDVCVFFYISTISWCVGSVVACSAASCVIEGKLKGEVSHQQREREREEKTLACCFLR